MVRHGYILPGCRRLSKTASSFLYGFFEYLLAISVSELPSFTPEPQQGYTGPLSELSSPFGRVSIVQSCWIAD